MEFWIGFGCGVVCAMFAAFMMCLTLFVVQLIGQKGEFYGGEMDENVFAAIIRSDKAKTFICVKPFY